MRETPDLSVPLAPSTKRQVPNYIASKVFVVACMASNWFATAVILLIQSAPDCAIYAAIGALAFALTISVIAAWCKYVEHQEDKLFRELRR